MYSLTDLASQVAIHRRIFQMSLLEGSFVMTFLDEFQTAFLGDNSQQIAMGHGKVRIKLFLQ